MTDRIAFARRREARIGLFALTLCALPGLAEAAEPSEKTEAEKTEAKKPEVPGEQLAKLASQARTTCREVAKIELDDPDDDTTYSSLLPPAPDTTGMSKKAKEAALAEYGKAREAALEDVLNVIVQCGNYCAIEPLGGEDAKFKALHIDLCDLESPSLAAVTVLVASDEASKAAQELETIVQKIEAAKQRARGEEAGPKLVPGAGIATTSAIAAALGLGSGTTTDLTAGLAKALADFVRERAKREALAWVLDRMSKDLCPADEATEVDQSKQWFPHLCALAGDDRLGSYAAGAALLEALQGALVEDARSWPGIMVGSKLGARPDATETDREAIKRAAERAFDQIARGNNPALALHGLGIEIAALDANKHGVSGCALALPAGFLSYHEQLQALRPSEPAAFLAALVGVPECFELISPAGPAPNPAYAKTQKILHVWQTHEKQLRPAAVTGAALAAAQQEYDSAMAAQPSTAAQAKPAADANQPDPLVVRRQSATVTLYGNSVEFTRMSVATLEVFEHEWPDVSKADLAAFKTDLAAFDTVAKLLDAQLHERWGEAVALLARHVHEDCGKDCNSLIERLGTVAAMLTAGDDDEAIEDALRAAAHPPGGWRSKAKRGAFTVSLTAFPGLYTAAELRWGPYGAVVENGDVYAQAPTLAMPIGLDFAWGVGKRTTVLGVFVPIVDPAAFLAYDVAKDGKLPGARLTTVLSPGLGFRITPPRTPFAILAYATYRPQFRTWEATLDGPGANVLQFGLNLAVDVTLWTIMSGESRR